MKGGEVYQSHEGILILRLGALIVASSARSAHARIVRHLELLQSRDRLCGVLC